MKIILKQSPVAAAAEASTTKKIIKGIAIVTTITVVSLFSALVMYMAYVPY